MRNRYIWDRTKRTFVPRSLYRRRRSQGPSVINDTMDQVQSMADGKWYDSKSRIRAEYKARGYEELGNERVQNPTYEPPSAAQGIVDTMKQRGEW